jgi:hypothetical protein
MWIEMNCMILATKSGCPDTHGSRYSLDNPQNVLVSVQCATNNKAIAWAVFTPLALNQIFMHVRNLCEE